MNVALITARGGSKGLPRKNVLPAHGKPLIAWTIEAAMNAKCIEEVFVSTDNKEIKQVSMGYGATVIDRPAELAGDAVSSSLVVKHAIHSLNQLGIKTITLLQPTSPLRTALHIEEAFRTFDDSHAQMVVSVFEPRYHPAKAYVLETSGNISSLINNGSHIRRQDLPKAYQPNGAIYIFDTESFSRAGDFPKEDVYPYVMKEAESLDIDGPADLEEFVAIKRGER